MSYTLVSVGGTGKDFAMFLGWLNQLGFIKPPSHAVIIDGDPFRENEVLDLLGFANESNTFSEQSRILKPFVQTPEVSINLLHQFNLNANNQINSPMMNLAFSENEQNMDVATGFYSNPKVASSIFVNKETRMPDIMNAILKGTEVVSQPIVIVGSISGGTGAGLIYNIAKMCKEKKAPNADLNNRNLVLGLVYTKYLNIGLDGSPNDVDLAYNSANGLDFLWKNWRKAFDSVFVSGVPEKDCVQNETATIGKIVAPYPPFLVAAQLFNDGLEKVIDKHIQHLVTLHPHQRHLHDGFHIYATRADENKYYLNANQIQFYVSQAQVQAANAQFIKISEMRKYLQEVTHTLNEILAYPLDQILHPFSMFPIKKLPPKLVEAFKNATPNRNISIAKVKDFYENHLKPNCEKVLKTCHDFNHWLTLASQNGLLLEDIEKVGNLHPKQWLDSFGNFEATHLEKGAQKALKPTYTKLIDPIPYSETQFQSNRWILPYFQGAINGMGWVRIPNIHTQPMNTEVILQEERESGSCYPSPLGRMEYFKQKLKVASRNHTVNQEAVTIWYGIALGELYIETINLEQYTNLEKAISYATNQKKIGIVRNKDHQVVAASDPMCGFWSGLRTNANLAPLRNLLSNQDHLSKARSVLKYWLSQVNQRLNARADFNVDQMINDMPWYRFLNSLDLQTATDLSDQDIAYSLGTHSPIALQIDSQTTDFFYPLFYQPFRKQIRNHLISTLIASNIGGVYNPHAKEFQLQRNELQRGYIDVLFNKIKVASIKLPLSAVEHHNVNVEQNKQEGVFHLKIEKNYPVWTIDQSFFNRTSQENLVALITKFERYLGYHIAYLSNHFINEISPNNKPELFW